MKQATTDRTPASLWKRLAWFAGIWLASVLALTLFAYAIRMVLIH